MDLSAETLETLRKIEEIEDAKNAPSFMTVLSTHCRRLSIIN